MTELISTMAQVPLQNGATARWEAIDPSGGNPVAGVIIHDATLYGYDTASFDRGQGAEKLPPLFVPIAGA